MISLSECDQIYIYDYILIVTRGGQRPSHFSCEAFKNQALMADTLKKTFRMFCYLFLQNVHNNLYETQTQTLRLVNTWYWAGQHSTASGHHLTQYITDASLLGWMTVQYTNVFQHQLSIALSSQTSSWRFSIFNDDQIL